MSPKLPSKIWPHSTEYTFKSGWKICVIKWSITHVICVPVILYNEGEIGLWLHGREWALLCQSKQSWSFQSSLQWQIMEGVKIRMENNFQREVRLGKDREKKPLELKRHQQYHGCETEATNHLDRGLMFMVITPRYYADNENASCATFEWLQQSA